MAVWRQPIFALDRSQVGAIVRAGGTAQAAARIQS